MRSSAVDAASMSTSMDDNTNKQVQVENQYMRGVKNSLLGLTNQNLTPLGLSNSIDMSNITGNITTNITTYNGDRLTVSYYTNVSTLFAVQNYTTKQCGGNRYNMLCKAGTVCTTTIAAYECPSEYFCDAGSNKPHSCPPLSSCPAGDTTVLIQTSAISCHRSALSPSSHAFICPTQGLSHTSVCPDMLSFSP